MNKMFANVFKRGYVLTNNLVEPHIMDKEQEHIKHSQ